jgi:predicted TPR repeat methyltransferase
LTGVDLSAGMLAVAREKQLYDELVQGELTEFLESRVDGFDLIVSADTLVYFGDLSAVITAAARALRRRGRLVCTLEHLADRSGADYRLEWHGRYSHSRQYIAALLVGRGLSSTIEEAELRMEAGKPVAGLVIHAQAK